jgi:hypothetical protein
VRERSTPPARIRVVQDGYTQVVIDAGSQVAALRSALEWLETHDDHVVGAFAWDAGFDGDAWTLRMFVTRWR